MRQRAPNSSETLPDDVGEAPISAWSHERRWSIRGTEPFQSMPLIEGRTNDLAEVARAARAWHDGAALNDIRRGGTFVHLTGRFEVPDHDPARLTESEWQHAPGGG